MLELFYAGGTLFMGTLTLILMVVGILGFIALQQVIYQNGFN